jgi:hypothetical protein
VQLACAMEQRTAVSQLHAAGMRAQSRVKQSDGDGAREVPGACVQLACAMDREQLSASCMQLCARTEQSEAERRCRRARSHEWCVQYLIALRVVSAVNIAVLRCGA